MESTDFRSILKISGAKSKVRLEKWQYCIKVPLEKCRNYLEVPLEKKRYWNGYRKAVVKNEVNPKRWMKNFWGSLRYSMMWCWCGRDLENLVGEFHLQAGPCIEPRQHLGDASLFAG